MRPRMRNQEKPRNADIRLEKHSHIKMLTFERASGEREKREGRGGRRTSGERENGDACLQCG